MDESDMFTLAMMIGIGVIVGMFTIFYIVAHCGRTHQAYLHWWWDDEN